MRHLLIAFLLSSPAWLPLGSSAGSACAGPCCPAEYNQQECDRLKREEAERNKDLVCTLRDTTGRCLRLERK